MTVDPFGTAAVRAAALGAWQASPARLREDANVEEDHARGYYRDRVVVELAQNAADAALRAGVPGRLLLRLARTEEGTTFVAANTGAPLDESGVASLASMRASSKRDAGPRAVGRFGVGFAAVRAVADEVSVLSTTGGVRFSLRDTAAMLDQAGARVPALAEEVRRRDGSLPALRLPLPTDGSPPSGYDTAVVLELRDEVAADEVRVLLRAVGDPLLLALPGLVEILVEDADAPPRRIAGVHERWTVASDEGELPLALLADRPVEERAARSWRVTWAVPRGGAPDGGAPRVVHAPTPTDDPLDLPALLVATLPLDPTRRHVAAGPLADAVLEHASAVYAALAATLAAAGEDPLALVPTGLPAGPVDAALRPRVLDALGRMPLLTSAADPGRLVPAALAVALAGPVRPDALAALGGRIAGLVTLPHGRETQARALGVDVRSLADLVEDVPAAEPGQWLELYEALASLAHDGAAREALGSLPVPLVDGRVVRGARGTLVVPPDLDADALAVLAGWGVRIVDPRAAHALLERVGAQGADAVALLRRADVRRAALDAPDDEQTTETVLALASAGPLPDDVRAWTGLLELPAADGELTPADGLVLPGSAAADLLDPRVMAPLARDVLDRWGADALVAVGVRRDLVVVTVEDVLADPASLGDGDDPAALQGQSLDGWEDYLEHLGRVLGDGAYVGQVAAIADLDAVDDGRLVDVLARLARDPELRRAVLEPVRSETGGTASSYTAWWLRERSGLDLGEPFLLVGAHGPLVRSAPEAVRGLDPELQRALGGVTGPGELDARAWSGILARWEPGTEVPVDAATAVWRWAAPDEVPDHLPALVAPGRIEVVPAVEAAVADAPMWWQRTDVAAMVPASDAGRAAAVFDLPRAAELAPGQVGSGGVVAPVPDAVHLLLRDAPRAWTEHDDLTVDGVPVEWWVQDGQPHAVHLAGLASALAQCAGRWDLRYALEAVLVDPARAVEAALDQLP
ncbi:ATP-binding protein [Cellulomonas edaphi]|uniref:ATP-binding protein n=1 Tax=Cellulomonas edaphi TaxID=3053468 RepID=A0ABT7S649_9CELL|nr:ATP-binding protein [Cellulomons edaphi]MDM7830527.1 ATP-binding protein [Cellulomons edaphi]